MFLRRKKIIFSLFLFIVLFFYQRINPSEQVLSESAKQTSSESRVLALTSELKQQAQVLRVIDGDTIEVLLDPSAPFDSARGKGSGRAKVRVIGINTPETVDPRRPVECFGKEVSKVAKEIFTNQSIELVSDPSQQNIDKYGRLLRYVYINNIDYGKFMIENGYAYEYTYDLRYKYQNEYKITEKQAKEKKIGLWADNACKN